jgi:hypothetical protein
VMALDETRNREGAIKRPSGMGGGIRGLRWGYFCLTCLAMVLSSSLPALSQNQQPGLSEEPGTGTSAPGASANSQQPDQRPDEQLLGSINGMVLDGSGTAVIGARVQLTRDAQSQDPAQNRAQTQETLSRSDGTFFFGGVAPGNFQLIVASEGFATRLLSGTLHSGETDTLPPITLILAAANTSVEVIAPQSEIAEDEIKAQEKQRLLGVIPNFYVSYIPDAAPLDAKQKFELAWKSTIDPITFALTGALAGIEQADNTFSGYGQGAQGYGKRFGAAYADTVTGTFIGGALLPSLLRQDPRYFYKGRGSVRSRFFYAIANSVICKGDNQRWQPDYSGVLGSLAAGAISNLYYPAGSRSGLALMFENTGVGIGETAVANIFQEFVVRKLTLSLRNNNSGNSEPAKP